VYSVNLCYGKTWASAEEITTDDKLAFRRWVEGGLRNTMAVGGSKPRDNSPAAVQLASRTSERVEQKEANAMASRVPASTPGSSSSDAAAAAAAAREAATLATAAASAAAASCEEDARNPPLGSCRVMSWHTFHLLEEADAAAQRATQLKLAAELAAAAPRPPTSTTAAAASAAAAATTVDPAVARCVERLKDLVVLADKFEQRSGDGVAPRRVASKRAARRKQSAPSTRRLPISKRRRRAPLQTGRRHRTYDRRRTKLDEIQADKLESDVEWLALQVARLSTLLATRRTAELLPEGDYSDAALDRVQRQGLVLRDYYARLVDAIKQFLEHGQHYTVYDVAAAAGCVLGDEHAIDHRSVREYSADYIKGGGVLQPDGRGHYTRELLINEEDVHRKFVKWSLASAKKDALSVEAARDYLNDVLLPTLPQATLDEYKIRLPIALTTTWEWMKVRPLRLLNTPPALCPCFATTSPQEDASSVCVVGRYSCQNSLLPCAF